MGVDEFGHKEEFEVNIIVDWISPEFDVETFTLFHDGSLQEWIESGIDFLLNTFDEDCFS